jgi:hypothetical protein
MDLEQEIMITCPYCGAHYKTVCDTSTGDCSMVEDCEVCCHPITINLHCHVGTVDSVDCDR